MSKDGSKPILPALMAKESLEQLRGFVSALLYSRKSDTSKAILECLFDEDPIVKGPFLTMGLPFVVSSSDEWPLAKKLRQFPPYSHQLQAYKRLVDGKHTLVTTGTGSGKSECFINPILDYVLQCKKSGKMSGVKALVIYPMNALIDDQSERFCETANLLNRDLPQENHIRIGRYTGHRGSVKRMDPSHPGKAKLAIDDRDELCKYPPDILLTNYRMLDFMLFRPEEQNFWGEDTKEVFRYLVLDELHTFDGAQGADVACLIRRLRLKIEGEITCVGTSATIAGGGRTGEEEKIAGKKDLCNFASNLFGTVVDTDSVIEESRLSLQDFLSDTKNSSIPKQPVGRPEHLSSLAQEDSSLERYDRYISSICENWDAPIDPLNRAEWIKTHKLTKKILSTYQPGIQLHDLGKKLALNTDLVYEYIDLMASSRVLVGKSHKQLLPINTQVWISETGALLRELSASPKFYRRGGAILPEQSSPVLPAVNCRSCGVSGWASELTEAEDDPNQYELKGSSGNELTSVFDRKAVVFFTRAGKDDSHLEGRNHFYFDYEISRLVKGSPEVFDGEKHLLLSAVFLSRDLQRTIVPNSRDKKRKNPDLDRCPVCDTPLSISLSAVGNSMLSSVATGSFLTNDANPSDRKLLIFNDSVQDAAHQAGYLGARSYRFNIRKLLWSTFEDYQKSKNPRECTFEGFIDYTKARLSELWADTMAGKTESKYQLIQFTAKDLWERWKAQSPENPFNSLGAKKELIERVCFEFWLEITVNRDLGWSLKKTNLLHYSLKRETLKEWEKTAVNAAIKTQYPSLKDPEAFVRVFSERMLKRGISWNEDLAGCYSSSKYSLWPLLNTKNHLAALFGPKTAKPYVMNVGIKRNTGKKSYDLFSNLFSDGPAARTWYERWANKNAVDSSKSGKEAQFLKSFVLQLAAKKCGIKPINDLNPQHVVIDEEALALTTEKLSRYTCQVCSSVVLIPPLKTMDNIPCDQYHCDGSMEIEQNPAEENFEKYLKSQYVRDVCAPYPHVHTGQLKSEDRRMVETAFKNNLLPGDFISGESGPKYEDHLVNVLACTPTMEMGIDIGSLSGVMLRGFPRTLSNTLQRLGRAGRSSGNSFNLILASRKPHDMFHWNNPSEIFSGSVRVPGCEYRTKDILQRQFHAYLFDEYARVNDVSLPKPSELSEKMSLVDHPYWVGLEKFLLDLKPSDSIYKFLTEVEKGGQSKFTYSREEVTDYLHRSLESGAGGFWQRIKSVLIKQDIDRMSSHQKTTELDVNIENSKAAKDLNFESLNDSNIEEKTKQKDVQKSKYRKNQRTEYTLKLLADKGILPNYAFPEEGIKFGASISVPMRKISRNELKRFKRISVEFSRPAITGIVELSPNRSFYYDGFKIPVTRLVKPDAEDGVLLKQMIVCETCNSVTRTELPKNSYSSSCPVCGAEDQDVILAAEINEVYGTGDFKLLQIRDDEEDRESSPLNRDVFVNYRLDEKQAAQENYATWTCREKLLGFEFRKNANIHFLVRGEEDFHGNHSYFTVCKECWAVPYRNISPEDPPPVFKRNGQPNRHSYNCPHFNDPNHLNIETVKISMSHEIESDSIRFFADNTDQVPTLSALLKFAMKIRLGGDPNHIKIIENYLDDGENNKLPVITLYDGVPGGTGHLSSLMPLRGEVLEKELSGLSQLNELFSEVKRLLEDCNTGCEDGCYNCLLSYDNQFRHKDISKKDAINWLTRFLEAKDAWRLQEIPLTHAMAQKPEEFGHSEAVFVKGLLHQKPAIYSVSSVESIENSEFDIYRLISDHGDMEILHTHEKKVLLSEDVYTKPDFTFQRGSEILGYLYVDGAGVHLNNQEDSFLSIFEANDIKLRSMLQNLMFNNNADTKVLTFSLDMVSAWTNWAQSKRLENTTEYSCQNEFKDPRPRVAKPLIGTKYLHILCALIGHLFVPKFNFRIDDREEIFTDLFIGFVANTLSDVFGYDSPFMDNVDKEDFALILSSIPDKASFGGLTFQKSNEKPKFFMDASREARFTESGSLDHDFKRSWELFWILWYTNRDLVEIKRSKS